MPDLPPWMVTNPLAGVPLYLSGFSSGAQAGESIRQGEQAAYNADLQAQEAQQRNEMLRDAQRLQAQEFAEGLKIRQETAKRAAAESAIQMEGQQGFEKEMQGLIASGIAPDVAYRQALPKWAPKLFYKHEQSLSDVMKGLAAPKDKIPQAATVGGRNVIYGVGGQWRFNEPAPTSVEAVPITDPDGKLLGYGRPGPAGTIIPLPPPKASPIHRLQRALELKRAALAGAKADPENAFPSIAERQAEVDALEKMIPSDGASAPAPTAVIPPMPAKKESLVKGQTYLTPRGPAVWNGAKFDPVVTK